MGKRGPRNPSPLGEPLRAIPGTERIADVRERPPVSWDRMVLKEDQAAEFLKVSRSTLRAKAEEGCIPRHRLWEGGDYRYYVYDLIDLMGPGETGA